MIKRTVFAWIAGFSVVSCASAGATQPYTLEKIEGFTPSTPLESHGDNTETGSRFIRAHTGAVLALASIPGSERFFSAGKDGFLSCHNPDGTDETWQLSDIALRKIALHPDGNLVASYESDGFSIHRISVWDWKNKKRLFAKRFRDSVMSLSWSAKGKLLMIGNTSLEGITILDGTTGAVQNIFASPPGIVTLSLTGNTETSMITFGPSGRILYTDIGARRERAAYSGESDLANPVILNNNMCIAGFKNDAVIMLEATSGKTVASYDALKPVMASHISDTQPVWFQENASGDWQIRSGIHSSPAFRTPDGSAITSAVSLKERIVFGTAGGNLYALQKTADYTAAPAMSTIAENTLRSIDDIVSDGSQLFFLSSGSVFISSGPGKSPVFAFGSVEGNRLAIVNNSLLCWSDSRSVPVLRLSFDGETRETVYQPKEGIRSISVSGTIISLVEGNNLALVLDTASDAMPFSYTGAGLQDAQLISENRLVVSKSATLRSPSPVILINTNTGETVPLPVAGELCFGLKKFPENPLTLNGFIIKAGDTTSTELVSITVDLQAVGSTTVRTVASYADEDLVASVLADGDSILTNLGKSSLVEMGEDGRQNIFERGYALPLKISVMDRFIVSLNYDGSLTWFDRQTHNLLATSSITRTGLWTEQ